MMNKIFTGSLAVVDGGGGGGGELRNPVIGSNLQGKTGLQFFQTFIPNLITFALIIGAIIFFFILTIGAIQWVSSGGDKNALEGARNKITNALIGIIILFAVFALLKVIENFFGIKILTLDISPLTI